MFLFNFIKFKFVAQNNTTKWTEKYFLQPEF